MSLGYSARRTGGAREMHSVADDVALALTGRSGEAANGDFRCAACGYGVVVLRSLPRCPMCAGQIWVASDRGPLRRVSAEPEEVRN